jgi:AcrR family transcriptional regulator
MAKPRAATNQTIEGRRSDKRLALVDASARVFAQRGYHNTTIDDIVEATGMTRGGLYYYISGKKDLLGASHARYLEPLLEETAEIESSLPPREALRAIVQVMMRFHVTYPDHVAVFLREWQALQGEPEWEPLHRDRRRFEELVTNVLEAGRANGEFTFEDAAITLRALMGMVNFSAQWFDPAGRVSASDLADHYVDIFLNGIGARA